jgi:hypothetical protein
MAKTNTLFLLTCSNGKRPGGQTSYNTANGLLAELDVSRKRELLKARQTVHQVILEGSRKRDSLLLSAFPRNANLVAGADFGGLDRTGTYLPAAERYCGSFYRAMGQDASALLLQTGHHILMISGLYGLVKATELIQDYSCHIDDHPAIRPIWQPSRLLTNVLTDYLRKHSITQVFDVTALRGYRELINWNAVKQDMLSMQIWHAFGEQTTGDGLLTPLGELLGQWLRTNDHAALDEITSGVKRQFETTTDRISFLPEHYAPKRFPRERPPEQQVVARKDEIVRLARCVKYLVADLARTAELNDLHPVIDSLRTQEIVDSATASAMHRMLRRRDKVEHWRQPGSTPSLLADQLQDFKLIRKWVEQSEFAAALEECQDS